MKKYAVLPLCLSLIVVTACVAPLSRTSELRKGLAFEVGGGLSEYRGHALVKDNSHWLGYQPVLRDINVGGFGMARVSYGFGSNYGADLTLAGAWGAPIRSNDRPGGWMTITVGGKYRPWTTNNLFFAELSYPTLEVGWVGGFPMRSPERWSLVVKTGTGVPDSIPSVITADFLGELLPPTGLQFNLSRNFYGRRRRYRVSPNVGIGLGFDWSPFKTRLTNVIAGVTFQP